MRISVLLPVYNGLPFLGDAIASVLSQECPDWELVISDNGSTDGTRDYLRALRDPRIRTFEQPSNLGIMGNLNFLLAQARAPVAKILGHDDMLLPGALERTAQFMEERPDCAVSRCWAKGDPQRYAKGAMLRWELLLPCQLKPDAALLAFATFGNVVGNICRAACRPQQVLQAGGFDQNYPSAGDYEAWQRVAGMFGICLQNEELVFERTHAMQDSHLQNQKNAIYLQINSILEILARKMDPALRQVLKRHWTIHVLSPRFSRFVRQLGKGRIHTAMAVWQGAPLGISAVNCIAAYPAFKLNMQKSHVTTARLLGTIRELNAKHD